MGAKWARSEKKWIEVKVIFRGLKMKIVFLNITQGVVDRGAETFVKEVSERLAEKHMVRVISGNKTLPQRWPLLWRFFLDANGLTVLLFTLKSIPVIWKEKYDVVVPVNGGWQSILVRMVTWFYGGKVVISGQSGYGWDDFVNLLTFPNAFAALSSNIKNRIKKINPLVRVEHIPNGVDLVKFNPRGNKIKIGLQKPVFLCVGAFEKGKRIDLAIKAVSQLEKGSLLIVGRGEKEEELKKLASELLPERSVFMKIANKELPSVYRAADVFTLVSNSYYSFEIVLAEAMATNLPVVANNDPIRKEIVDDAGILVDPFENDEYSKALKKAVVTQWENKPRRQAEKFSWDLIAKKYEDLFNSLSQ